MDLTAYLQLCSDHALPSWLKFERLYSRFRITLGKSRRQPMFTLEECPSILAFVPLWGSQEGSLCSPWKGDGIDSSNYRTIAITYLLSKVMERVVNTQLLDYLEDYQLISDRQDGFRRACRAGDFSVYFTYEWATVIESKREALGLLPAL